MTPKEIEKAIIDVLYFEGKFIYFLNGITYPEGSSFYRARKLKSLKFPKNELMYESHFWNTPSEYITSYGRLNKPGESLLYTTPDFPKLPLQEIKIPDNSYYALIVYEAISEIKVTTIGEQYNGELSEPLSKKVKLIMSLLNSFLKEEFSRDVGEGTEYLYVVSEIITKMVYDRPSRYMQDALGYSSLKDKEKYNVCFRPESAKEVLRLKGTLLCEKLAGSDEIYVNAIQSGFDSFGKARLHFLGSEEQKRVFPEITGKSKLKKLI